MIKIDKKKDGKFAFKLKSSNGKTLLKSVSFSSKEELDKTLKDFKDLKEARTKFFERKWTLHFGGRYGERNFKYFE